MQNANIIPFQEVEVWDISNGERFRTYAIPGLEGSGVVCLNGAAARKVCVGDVVIVAVYGFIDEREAEGTKPRIVKVDARNRVLDVD